MSQNKLETEVRIRVTVDLDAWARQYGESVEQAREMALEDLRLWARNYYTETKWYGLAENMSQKVKPIDPPKNINRKKAEAVRDAVSKLYDAELWGAPTLYVPDYHCTGWAVVWEEAPEEWIQEVRTRVKIPGVFIEPVNHWCVGLYPAA